MADARWLEVSLTVEGELAEAVAEVIGRFTAEGVVIEQAVKYNDSEDEGVPYGSIRVYGYLENDAAVEVTRQNLEQALWHLSQIMPLPQPEYREIEDQDWMAAWKAHYRPIPVGERLLILPAWLEPGETDRIPVKINPSMAFGTGTHPTTQLCLALAEKFVVPGKPVIDVGCGSGILSIAAVLLGASRAVCVDIDQAAIRATHENANANCVFDSIDTGVGSVMEILQGQFLIRRAPLVLVNILAPVIIRLLGESLTELLTPGGCLILSGILADQSDQVEAAAEEQGLRLVERMQMGDWVAMAYRKE